jgi:hypothetical protein
VVGQRQGGVQAAGAEVVVADLVERGGLWCGREAGCRREQREQRDGEERRRSRQLRG